MADEEKTEMAKRASDTAEDETAKKARPEEEPKEPAKVADDSEMAQSEATKRVSEEAEETALKKARTEEDAHVDEASSEKKAEVSEEVLELDVDIDSSDVVWFTDNDGEYLKKLEELAGATVEFSAGVATMRPKGDKWLGGDAEWAEQILHAFCAYHRGKTADLLPYSQFKAWDPPLSVVSIPSESVRSVLGANAVQSLSKACDTISVLANENTAVPSDAPGVVVEIGSLVEAYNTKAGRWLEATIVNIGSRRVTVKWEKDDGGVPQSLVLRSKLRPLSTEDSPKESSTKFEAGELVEAFFASNKRWFEAKVIKATDKGYVVKWTYDDDVPESTVPESDIRPLPGSVKPKEDKEVKEERASVQEGDLVEALFAKNGRWFEAKVLKVDKKFCTVKWTYDDDIPSSKVPIDEIRPLASSTPSKTTSTKFKVGDIVEAFFAKNGKWFEAKIVEVNRRGCVVKWTYDDDIPTSNLSDRDIRIPGTAGSPPESKDQSGSPKFFVGDLVEGFYKKNKKWFEAKILKPTKLGWMVEWTYDPSGGESDLSEKDMRPLPGNSKVPEATASDFQVGDLVEAYFAKNSRWFEAKILEVSKRGVTVKWTYDDDVPNSNLPFKDVRALPGSKQKTKQKSSTSAFEVGDLVEAFYDKSQQWFEAKILKTSKKGFIVKWTYDDDVPESDLPESKLRPLPGSSKPSTVASASNFGVGDLVEAFFAKNGKWFEAEILEISKRGARVKWTYDDGVPASEVQLKDIRPLPGSSKDTKSSAKTPSVSSYAVGDLVDALFEAPAKEYQVGDIIEAKFGKKKRFFEAKIIKVGETTLTVQWTYDEAVPEEEISRSDVKETSKSSTERWFEAVVKKIDEDTVTLKWTYDDDVPESVVQKKNVKARPTIETDPLHIYGELRSRLSVELQVLSLVEAKVPGFVSSKPRESDACEGVGISVVKLLNSGEFKSILSGSNGSMKSRISLTCGSSLEYIGHLAYIVGTLQERTVTSELLRIIQAATNGEIESLPSALEAMCTLVRVPAAAYKCVKGRKRVSLTKVEEDAGVIAFSLPAEFAEGEAQKEPEMQLSEGMKVEARFSLKKGYFDATVLEFLQVVDIARLRWEYDPDETSYIHRSDIREIGYDAEEAAEPYLPKTVAIIGPVASRNVAELKVKAMIETKLPGTFSGFTFALDEDGSTSGHSIEKLKLSEAEFGRCDEQRRQTSMTAARCTIEKLGKDWYLAGTGLERSRAKDYLSWLTMESPKFPDASTRDDIDIFDVPDADRASVIESIPQVEARFGTIIFVETKEEPEKKCTLLICGGDAQKRSLAIARLRPTKKVEPLTGKRDRPQEQNQKFVVSDDEMERRKKRAMRFS
eukprot:CAMPEP_0169116940 /NCGR_PEP_ID=MMETSP1015-20121227/30177_1 /TAXON_ID=342587 /ORGANISM="Karlodinium micrum, Strain CCMP2283" /LENGTH=1349 /DNA_ID=CAMNT_0009179559 /DNA_START=112 /DNA_END=4161 /DNA_ORIENTATION=-